MKLSNILSKNLILNLIISACLGFSYLVLDDGMELMSPGYNPIIGGILLLIIIVSTPFLLIKARDLSFKSKENISQGELFLVAMIYFMALFTIVLIAYMACGLLENRSSMTFEMSIVFWGISAISVFFFLWECWTIFIVGPKKRPREKLVKHSNIIIPFYAGVIVSVLWEGAFDESWEASPIGLRKIFLSLILALVLIIPFQRLSWHENFLDSKTGKENKKSLLSIGITVAVAVAGVL